MAGLTNFRLFFSYKNAFWALFYLFLFCLLLNNSFRYLDPDLGWHLKVGEDILRERLVPHLNYYNYTLEGKTWVDHEWLLNIITYWLYEKTGNIGLNVFFALLITAALAILHRTTKKKIADQTDSPLNGPGPILLFIFFLSLGVIAMSPHLGVRMQEIALLCLILLYLILDNYGRTRKAAILLWLLPLFYFWSLSHASFLIGIFILFFWLLIKTIELILKNKFSGSKIASLIELDDVLPKKQLAAFFIFSLSALAATCATPYGFELYGFLSGYADKYYLTHIAEWLPGWYFPLAYWQLTYLAIALAGVFLFFFNAGKPRKINLWELSIFFLFFFLSFKSKRHFPLFFVSTLALVIKYYLSLLYIEGNNNFFDSRPRFLRYYLLSTIFLVSVSLLVETRFTNSPFTAFCGEYPCGALAYLKERPEYENLNIFNEYAWGGYLIWTWPEKKLFIDGRLPQVPLNGHSLLAEYMDFYKKENLPGKLEEYKIGLALVSAHEKDFHFSFLEKLIFSLKDSDSGDDESDLVEFLKNASDWKEVYRDGVAVIYEKK